MDKLCEEEKTSMEEGCTRCGKEVYWTDGNYLEIQSITSNYEWFEDIDMNLCERCTRSFYNTLQRFMKLKVKV
jgi:ribosomal protein L37E